MRWSTKKENGISKNDVYSIEMPKGRKEMTNTQSIKCEMCGKEMLPEETLVIEEGKGFLVCDKCAWEHNKAS